MPPDPPQGRVLPILRPGVKLSCPPVQNLNEPPGEPFYSRKEIEEWILHEHENLSKRQNCYYARQNELGKLFKVPQTFS